MGRALGIITKKVSTEANRRLCFCTSQGGGTQATSGTDRLCPFQGNGHRSNGGSWNDAAHSIACFLRIRSGSLVDSFSENLIGLGETYTTPTRFLKISLRHAQKWRFRVKNGPVWADLCMHMACLGCANWGSPVIMAGSCMFPPMSLGASRSSARNRPYVRHSI